MVNYTGAKMEITYSPTNASPSLASALIGASYIGRTNFNYC